MGKTDTILISIYGILAFVLTIIDIIACTKLIYLSIPLSNSLAVSTVCLPLTTFLGPVVKLYFDVRRGGDYSLSRAYTALLFVLVIYSTSVLTLTSIPILDSQAASCRLDTQWRHLFETKNAANIRATQDALQCCGFRGTYDKAWPFQGGRNNIDACVKMFERTVSCESLWRDQERIWFGLMAFVAMSSLFGQLILLFYIQLPSSSLVARPVHSARPTPYSTIRATDELLGEVRSAEGAGMRGTGSSYSDDAESGNGSGYLAPPILD